MHGRDLLLAAGAAVLSRSVFAQSDNWPARPLRMVVPFAAGGPTDFIARLVAQPLSAELGQPVTVENQPGASGTIGSQAVGDADPDGYTLIHNTVGMHGIIPLMYPKLRFNPLRDLVGIATTGAMPNVLVVHPTKLGVRTVKELVDKGRDGRLTYATYGPGTSPHIYTLLLLKLAGIQATPVLYKGSAPAMADVMGGHVDFLFDNISTCAGQIQGGALVGLGIAAAQRSQILPKLPTMAEAGYPGFDLNFWFSLAAPVRTPAAIVDKLRVATAKVLAEPSYVDALRARGAEPFVTPPTQLEAFFRQESAKWAKTASDLGLRPE